MTPENHEQTPETPDTLRAERAAIVTDRLVAGWMENKQGFSISFYIYITATLEAFKNKVNLRQIHFFFSWYFGLTQCLGVRPLFRRLQYFKVVLNMQMKQQQEGSKLV